MPLLPVLTVIFTVAKITGYLDWPWWQVFSPMWGGFLLLWLLLFIKELTNKK